MALLPMNEIRGKLAPCPCGETPDYVYVSIITQGTKWAYVAPSCCATWEIEFRTYYNDEGSPELNHLALEAWNGAPRA